MAKNKKEKNKDRAKDWFPNKNIHLRLAFLHQAALHLAQGSNATDSTVVSDGAARQIGSTTGNDASVRCLLSQMKGIGRRSVIRLQSQAKRTVCKGCDQLLTDGITSTETVENKSKNSAKLHANVLVVQCRTCHTVKRFPVGAPRQEGKHERLAGTQAQGT